MDAFEAEGHWWLPETPEQRVPGTFRFDPDSGATLSLLGSFRGIFDEAPSSVDEDGTRTTTVSADDVERAGVYPMILGDTGTAYTLVDCFRTRLTNAFIAGRGSERVHVNQVLRGAHYESSEPVDANGVSFKLRYLVYWVGSTGLRGTQNFSEDGPLPNDVPKIAISGFPIADQRASFGDGSTVSLSQGLRASGDHIAEQRIIQDFTIRIDRPNTVPITDLIDLASDAQDLVSIAVDRTAGFETVNFWHPEVFHKIRDTRIPDSVEFFAQWSAREEHEPESLHRHDMLFTLPDIGGIDGLSRWLDLAALHRTALGRVMSSKNQGSMWPSDRLLNRTAALEAFDRTRTGTAGSKFKTRIKRCVELAGTPFQNLIGDTEKWCEALRQARDDVAHHLGREFPGQQHYFLAESAYCLFVLCMLREAGVPDAVVDPLDSFRRFSWIGQKVRALL